MARPHPMTAMMVARPWRITDDTQPDVRAPIKAPTPTAEWSKPTVKASPPNTPVPIAGNSAVGMPKTIALRSMSKVA